MATMPAAPAGAVTYLAPVSLERTLQVTADEGLLRTFAALTHRMHAARRGDSRHADLREQRDAVQAEILRRMAGGAR